jgi:hypothetical protein
MKNSIKFTVTSLFAMPFMVFVSSCKKDAVVTPTVATAITTVTTDASTLADAQTLSCQLADTVDIAMLPTTVSTYITTNYAGYTNQFVSLVKTSGVLTGYVANLVNGVQHVAARFDASGSFVKALPLPAHIGVEFDVFQTDTVAISTLPTALQAYLTANNTYNVQRIFTETDGSNTIIATQGTNAYALLYTTATPTALSVINLGAIDFTTPNPDITTLPANIATYISQNYNGATIERVLTGECSGGNNNYTIVFKKDTAQYAAEFDSTGAFMSVLKAN